MFIDEIKIKVKGGDGGNGIVSFHREKYVDKGGPDGGDGGNGGDVILKVDPGLNTLANLRYQNVYTAGDGKNGDSNNKTGASGDDLVLKIPPGTVVYDNESNELLADLIEEGEKYVVARGGKGGRGNARFKKATRRAPRFSEKGEKGEQYELRLEIKLLADVGLVGFPNVGKSTLISAVSGAKPKIAAYHFTTIKPNLGVVEYGEQQSLVMADVPGLIPGAHQGVGLGHQFLKHLERTRLLVHMIDVSGTEGREPLEDFRVINQELEKFKHKLATLPQVVALNKIDLPAAQKQISPVTEKLKAEGYEVFPVSAVTQKGVSRLIYHLGQKLADLPSLEKEKTVSEETEVVITPDFKKHKKKEIIIKKIARDKYRITGSLVNDLIEKTNMANEAAVSRMMRILKHHGLNEKMGKAGLQNGDTVKIASLEFDYVE